MWIFLNTGFISVVQDRRDSERVVIRARRPEVLMRLFPKEKILLNREADYRYRVFVRRAQLGAALCGEIIGIDYPNFKDSVQDSETRALYHAIWELGLEYQR